MYSPCGVLNVSAVVFDMHMTGHEHETTLAFKSILYTIIIVQLATPHTVSLPDSIS
ncbi:hypothetical protein LINPERPRIM_LOCUS36075, partial [Linum perenne]